MTLCDKEHEEVCFEGKTCPACKLREELNDEINELKIQIDELEVAE